MVASQMLEPEKLQHFRASNGTERDTWAWKRPPTNGKNRIPAIFEDIPLEKVESGPDEEPSTSMQNVDLENGDPLRRNGVEKDDKNLGDLGSRPLQSSLRQPRNGNEPKKGVSFSPDVPLEQPNRPPIHEIMRKKDNQQFFRRCCMLIIVIVFIVIGVLILASTIHDPRKDNSQILS